MKKVRRGNSIGSLGWFAEQRRLWRRVRLASGLLFMANAVSLVFSGPIVAVALVASSVAFFLSYRYSSSWIENHG